MREKLIELLKKAKQSFWVDRFNCDFFGFVADHLIANGVTVQERCYKAKSAISKTGLMCTACHSDIDRDDVFCKYCGANMKDGDGDG